MKLFSKRHSERRIGVESIRYRARGVHANELISQEARNRLVAEIKFLSSRDGFLEWHILFEDKRHKPSIIYYDDVKIDDFSLAELGYKMSSTFDFVDFNMKKSQQAIKYASDTEPLEFYFDDYRLFDLAEMTILFAKASQRKNVIERINNILIEESTPYEIVEHLITRKNGDDLRALLGIIKDTALRSKLERFFDYYSHKDFVNAAKISADIVNIIYSDEAKQKKKKQIEAMKVKLASRLITNTSSEKKERANKLLDAALIQARSLNNDIYDVRHTEKSTLTPHGDNVYKMVAMQNLIVIEITLTTLKDDFVLSDDWENIKSRYIEKYKIDVNSRRVYRPRPDEPIDLDDIPF